MGGKSRKTGGISKKLIDRIKNGDKLESNKESSKKDGGAKKPFHLSLNNSNKE